jgi:hypothetical protein
MTGGLALEQTGPHPLIFGTRRRGCIIRSGARDAEQTLHNLLWGTHPGRASEDGGNRCHALLIGLLTLGQTRCRFRARRLDHGNTLTIDGRYEYGSSGGLVETLPVKSVKVLGRIRQDLLQTAFGDGDTGQFGNSLDRIQERVLHGGFDQAPLEFVGELACGQGKRLVQWKDAGYAGAGVAHADEFDGSKDGGERAGAQPAMGIGQLAVLLLEVQRGSDISVTTLLQVGLEE